MTQTVFVRFTISSVSKIVVGCIFSKFKILNEVLQCYCVFICGALHLDICLESNFPPSRFSKVDLH